MRPVSQGEGPCNQAGRRHGRLLRERYPSCLQPICALRRCLRHPWAGSGAAERLLDMQLRCCSCSPTHAMCNACNESVRRISTADGEAGGRATVLCARNHSAGRTALLLGLRRLRRMIRTSRESTPVLLAAPPLPVSRGHAHELTLTRERRPIDRGAVNMLVSRLAAGWIGT